MGFHVGFVIHADAERRALSRETVCSRCATGARAGQASLPRLLFGLGARHGLPGPSLPRVSTRFARRRAPDSGSPGCRHEPKAIHLSDTDPEWAPLEISSGERCAWRVVWCSTGEPAVTFHRFYLVPPSSKCQTKAVGWLHGGCQALTNGGQPPSFLPRMSGRRSPKGP